MSLRLHWHQQRAGRKFQDVTQTSLTAWDFSAEAQFVSSKRPGHVYAFVSQLFLMRYSRLTARDEVAVNAGSSLENVLSNQYRAKARRQIREKIERLLWLIFSLTTIWYGDGKTNLVTWLYNRYSAVRLLNSLSGHSQLNSTFFYSEPGFFSLCSQSLQTG